MADFAGARGCDRTIGMTTDPLTGPLRYDPRARRDTPLAVKLKDGIGRNGPIGLGTYMRACLCDPEFGYYRTQTAIGREGDFITAPEISQVFGELVGLWCVVVWQQMGSPQRVNLIELGPGRGTLMRDALRAVRVVPAFLSAVDVRLVEISDVLKDQQRACLADCGAPVSWFERTRDVPAGPAIVIGNEFLDALDMSQWRRLEGEWRAVMVELDTDGNLEFGLGNSGEDVAGLADGFPEPQEGDVLEVKPYFDTVSALHRRAKAHPGAALFIDYGHPSHLYGDTLQAVRGHSYEHPLTSPGEADLTTQVDFATLAQDIKAHDLLVEGPITQTEFLGQLGIIERASRLMSANPEKAGEIEAGVARLLAPNGMGTRFKVLGVRSRGLPPLPGFAGLDTRDAKP